MAGNTTIDPRAWIKAVAKPEKAKVHAVRSTEMVAEN
jgi:hypothetical protein